MPVCVECGEEVVRTYRQYAGQNNVRLSRCQTCGHVADKYVEYETLLVALDVLLHRVQAFRHVLLNRQNARLTPFLQLALVAALASAASKWHIYRHWCVPLALTEMLLFVAGVLVGTYALHKRRKQHAKLALSASLLAQSPKLLLLMPHVWHFNRDGADLAVVVYAFSFTCAVTAVRAAFRCSISRAAASVLLGITGTVAFNLLLMLHNE
ncbi:MAG: hypothetical protein MHM6MM_004694 [Cercozoa sp. M6MM]